MLRTLMYFPMIAVLWFLLLVPGADTLRLRWRYLPLATLAIAAFGLWCAAAGTSLKTSTWTRHTGLYAMTLALVFALPAPAEMAEARRTALDPLRRNRCRQCLVLQRRSLAVRSLYRSRVETRHRRCRHDSRPMAFQATGVGGSHSFKFGVERNTSGME
jgi:hypothetical protein